jgi:hypothetical protein
MGGGMKTVVRALIVVALAPMLFAAEPVTQSLREHIKVEQALLGQEVAQYGDERAQLQEAWVRLERESADLMQAQSQGESMESLQLRDEDLRRAESELMMHLYTMQRVRRSILARMAAIEVTEGELSRLRQEVGVDEDPITGTWRLVMEPGGHEGLMSLQLNGTLVQGTYRLGARNPGCREGPTREDRLADGVCGGPSRAAPGARRDDQTAGQLGGHPARERAAGLGYLGRGTGLRARGVTGFDRDGASGSPSKPVGGIYCGLDVTAWRIVPVR